MLWLCFHSFYCMCIVQWLCLHNHYTVRFFTVCALIQWLCIQFKYKYYVVKVPLKTMATDPVARTRQVWVIYIYNGIVLHIKLGLNQRHQAGYTIVMKERGCLYFGAHLLLVFCSSSLILFSHFFFISSH